MVKEIVRPIVEILLKPLPENIDASYVEQVRRQMANLSAEVTQGLSRAEATILSGLEDLLQLCGVVFDTVEDVKKKLEDLEADAVGWVKDKLEELPYQDTIAKLEGVLEDDQEFQKQAEALADKFGDIEDSVRALHNDILKTVQDAKAYGDRVLDLAANLGNDSSPPVASGLPGSVPASRSVSATARIAACGTGLVAAALAVPAAVFAPICLACWPRCLAGSVWAPHSEGDGALPRPLRDRDHGAIGGDGMKITREFCPGDRYVYDFGLCSYEKGWAQVDTAQDASYFGTWANPTRLMIFSYCEGDTTLKEAASPEEFAAELREVDVWNRAHGYGPARIDPGFDPAMKAAFEGLGLADMLH